MMHHMRYHLKMANDISVMANEPSAPASQRHHARLLTLFLGMIRSCRYWNITKNTGTMNSNARVPDKSPPTVPTPTDILPLAPTPVANIKGNIPNTMVADVMIIGLKRAFAADIAAASNPIPSFRRAVAYSVSSIAVFASKPISMMRPICI